MAGNFVDTINMRQFLFIFCTTILVLCSFTESEAQVSGGDTGTLENVDILTVYKPDVAESLKIDIQPALEDPSVAPPSYRYRFPNVAYQAKPVYSPIDPVYLKKEDEGDLYDNYIELGGGNYLTSYLDASIFNKRDKYYTYGLNIKHHASSSSNNPEQGLFSQNRVTAFGERERGGRLKGIVDYQRNVVHYYGYLDSLNPFADTASRELGDINQIYNDISGNAIWSTSGSKRVNSMLDIGFNLFDKLGETENTFTAVNETEFDIRGGVLHLDLGAMYTLLSETAKYNRLFVDVKPHYEFKVNRYTLDLGVNVNYFNDSNTNLPFFAPHIKAETYLVPDKLRLYGKITGGLKKNTLKKLSYENLFLGDNVNYANTHTPLDIKVGMNGNFKRFIEYGIELGYDITNDQILFINDTNALANFTTVSDRVSRSSLAGEMKVDINENVDFGFRGNFYAYGMDNEAEAWHLPSYDVDLFTTFRFSDKLYIRGGYFGTSPRKSRNLANNVFNLKAIHDVNAGVEYRYKKNISGFLNINNILNQRYPIWNFYQSQGINVLAGVTISL